MSFNFADLFLNTAQQQEQLGPAPFGPIPHPPIRRPKNPQLTRDQRRDCQLLNDVG